MFQKMDRRKDMAYICISTMQVFIFPSDEGPKDRKRDYFYLLPATCCVVWV